ncbi:hypothetical protein SAMD00019534_064070 [Acytostelium subglobosum LB1]|uniref:hypothetical protein n=1 Tax=Acytostelium subglobosum LB1 TaxID=1410327 RepID=UPI000644E4C5|nr:hypothetical protein SAMD00019534_064070 [Acytostelium subglobosum LB1]GAM23232.1 hypothetical protein SAMD00019534_064070 [Acytostelium subglobosum LB1]|eukprot:XP_012753681.1 hypothetical protein SAMD00019534_064070 [Acytostelium subglobosum LB1]
MDDFETAILYSYDPSISEELKLKALAYTNTVKESPDGWKFCLEKLFQTKSIHVKFFCFHVFQDVILHRYEALTEQDRLSLKSTLITYLKVVLANTNEDTAIKNKYAQIVVLLFKQEYPEQWPQFFNDFLSMLAIGPNVIDIFLRILKSIDIEVVSFNVHRSTAELAHNTMIKDTMRDGAIKDIVSSWYEILVHYHQTNPHLANMALQNIKHYVGWIDINLIVNDRFIQLFFKLLNVMPLREEVCDCFKEIIYKGMDPSSKLLLIQKLQIKDIVNLVALDDLDFVVKIGSLVNLTGMEVLRGLESVAGNQEKRVEGADKLLDDFLELLVKFLNNEYNEVSTTVMPFSALYITKLKNVKPLNEKQLQHVTLLVQIIRNKMKYKKEFDFGNPEGEDEVQFAEFRKDLSNQFRNIFRICPEMVGSFVQTMIANITQDPDHYQFTDIEVAIYLLFQMGEGITATPEDTMKPFEKFFGSMVILLAGSRIITFELHQIVSLTYFETVVRYAKYVPHDPQNLGMILSAFLDQRGLLNSNTLVRSRAGYLLNKLVKQLKTQLFPYINNIIEALKNHLIISYEIQKEVPFDEQLNFYESLGFLIGGASLPPQEEQNYVEKILLNPYMRMEEIVTKGLYKTDTKEQPIHGTQLIQLISAIGTFSKGFTPINNSTGNLKPEPHSYKAYFIKSLKVILLLPKLLPHNEEIISRTFFYMHRMVDCLGNDLKPMLPEILSTLLNHTNSIEKLVEFILYVNQLMAKYKEELNTLINDLLQQIIYRLYKSMDLPRPPEPNTDEGRSYLELQKSYYSFILSILNNALAATLTSPLNINTLPQILTSIINGCTCSTSDSVQKTSFSILKRLIDEFGRGGPKQVDGFDKFVYSQIIPTCFQVPMAPSFNTADFASNQLVMEIAKSLKIISQRYGDEFINYLGGVYLAQINIHSPEVAQQFARLLPVTVPLKDFQDFFKLFIRNLKQQQQQQQQSSKK